MANCLLEERYSWRVSFGSLTRPNDTAAEHLEAPLGRLLSRKFVKAQFSRTLPALQMGYYEFLAYNTSFQRKAQAAEYVTLTKESGHWQVSGYHFR